MTVRVFDGVLSCYASIIKIYVAMNIKYKLLSFYALGD